MLVTAFLDLSRIAALGVFLYLSMDIAVQWGVARRLRTKIAATPWVPILVIGLDAAILIAFATIKIPTDPLTVIVALVVAATIVIAQGLVVRHVRRSEHEQNADRGS